MTINNLHWFSDEQLKHLTGASRATIYRWRKDGEPQTVTMLLEVLTGYNFKNYHTAWTGWGINRKDGELFSPNNNCFTAGQIMSIPYLHGTINALKARVPVETFAGAVLPFKDKLGVNLFGGHALKIQA